MAIIAITGIALALAVIQVIYSSLRCEELMDFFTRWNCSSEVEKLQNTLRTISAALLDAEAIQEQGEQLSHVDADLVEKLKDAAYDAADLIDEVLTRQLQDSQKVRSWFSKFTSLITASNNMAQKIKKIRKKLDDISSDATKFGSNFDYKRERMIRKVSSSQVPKECIFGREDDTENIIAHLLDPNVKVLSIVGMGGLGKTTLAQLVFNHPTINRVFPLRLWACISDQNKAHFDLSAILAEILKSTDSEMSCQGLNLQQLQERVRETLKKKYLLVLDDVWTESHDEWLDLANYLIQSGLGESRIVVTTRSKATATAVDSSITYELEGLSRKDSWHLFSSMAGEEQANRIDFLDISRDIVEGCGSVPLALRVAGSLLRGQDKTKWESFRQFRLTNITQGKNKVMSTLMFSYHHLPPTLKGCFSYCAVFHKDFIIEKQTLISLWMAQGFVEPIFEGQSIEDAAEEYFLILLRRCFFQDAKRDEYGEIEYCKMHDLMRDLAQEVAGNQIVIANSRTIKLDKNIRHLYDVAPFVRTESFIARNKTRTYLKDKNYWRALDTEVCFPVSMLVAKSMNLRALDLSRLGLRYLPVEIGELLHLRYLDLSMNKNLGMLPESITSLVNLQTLNLRQCEGLKELPNGMSKLVKLRFLDVRHVCLSYMPPDMGNLTCLRWLPWFVLKNSSKKQCVSELEDLKSLDLKGHLTIEITNDYEYVKENDKAGGYLSTKALLNDIEIYCGEEMMVRHQEDLLEDLLPHSNLKRLLVSRYNGVRIPSWARKDNLTAFLPNLETIALFSCNGLRELPWLGELPHLETLILSSLDDLECIEDTRDHNSRDRYEEATSSSKTGGSNSSRARETESLFFPSLKVLELCYLPKLTRWRRQTVSRHGPGPRVRPRLSMSFPRLSELTIEDCPELVSIPLCPLVEKLIMTQFNERLQLITKERQGEVGRSARESGNARPLEVEAQIVDNMSYFKSKAMGAVQCVIEKLRFLPLYSPVERPITIVNRRLRVITKEQQGEMGRSEGESGISMHPQIKTLTTDNVSYFKSFPMEAFQNLTDLTISEDILLESLSEIQELFYSCSSSLQSLSIISCENLISLQGVFQIGMPWTLLQKSLRYLQLQHEHMVELPDGMRFLTSLQSLTLYFPCLEVLPEWIGSLSSLESLELLTAGKLKSLPDTMQNLTSLWRLEITCCSQDLKERYQGPNGEEWLKIQHIPKIRITTDS